MPAKFQFLDFTIQINGTPGNYLVEARGPGQIAVPPEPFHFSLTPELQQELTQIARGTSPSRQRMQQVGELLFNALFPRRIIRAFGRSYDELPENANLRLKLIVRPPELNVLPWELLYDTDEGYFLAARLTYPLVRFIESTTPVANLAATRPLRLLYIQSLPADQTRLDLEASEQNIRAALGGLGQDVEIVSVRQAKPADLREKLRQNFHILHYDGHAFFDEQVGAGALVLQDKDGRSHHLSGELFSSYLDGSRVRLVVLAACQSAMDSPQKRFSGIAHQIMKSSSLPAVVAMQYEIEDGSAAAFNSGFYAALAEDYPVDAAVVEGRKAILERFQGDSFAAPDWATPVLFLRTEDGDILKSAQPVGAAAPDRAPQVDLSRATIHGNVNVAGQDIVMGNQVDNSIHTGNVTGSTGVAIGHGAQAHVGPMVTPDGPPIDGPAAGLAYTSRSDLIRLIRQRVSEDKLEDALRQLKEIDDQASILLQGQLKRLKNEFLLGTCSREDFATGRARIAAAILEIIK